jgi:hypothetical protein
LRQAVSSSAIATDKAARIRREPDFHNSQQTWSEFQFSLKEKPAEYAGFFLSQKCATNFMYRIRMQRIDREKIMAMRSNCYKTCQGNLQ